ncbi:hypothetical protein GCM10009560_03540 [Nonomuraea longicatena]|uniref:HTH cro/C1-type domain-containing protein n=1 Tax=Nonomuraea longicatena TaxID=83682 RepID=A0ABP3Z4V0_9ACTN
MALSACDMPVILGEVQRAMGWTQKQLADATGYSQSWISKVLRGHQPLTLEQVRRVSERLGIPLHLLRFSVYEENGSIEDEGPDEALAELARQPPSGSPHKERTR